MSIQTIPIGSEEIPISDIQEVTDYGYCILVVLYLPDTSSARLLLGRTAETFRAAAQHCNPPLIGVRTLTMPPLHLNRVELIGAIQPEPETLYNAQGQELIRIILRSHTSDTQPYVYDRNMVYEWHSLIADATVGKIFLTLPTETWVQVRGYLTGQVTGGEYAPFIASEIVVEEVTVLASSSL